jgi:cytochrome c biogenesis protein
MVTRLRAWLRNTWRQLTSMRTALVLLFLLALAAIPGSVLPQRTVSVESVNQWYRDNPDLAPLVDRLGGFNVFGSPWFSAIYLLLFVSLVGCIVPRIRDHARALRRAPVDAPRRLSRMPVHADRLVAAGSPEQAADRLHRALRSRRWRAVVRRHDDQTVTVSAEKGYLRETGNLLMHSAMVVILVGVALGSAYGWHGNRLVVAGVDGQFCNTLSQYDEFGLGTRMDGSGLPPFCLQLDEFTAEYSEAGEALAFLASAQVHDGDGQWRPVKFTVNSPLRLDGANVYLLGNGYAPVLRYTDRYGQEQTMTAPFLPIDSLGTAEGVAVFPDANVSPDGQRDPSLQVAFEGLYLPTASDAPVLTGSAHPDERDPRLLLIPYRGDLGMDSGEPRSVWTLDEGQIASGELVQIGDGQFLSPGESMTLDDGTTVEFLGTQRWITVSVRHDPGQTVAALGAFLLIAGVVPSLLGRRRRVWFRLSPAEAVVSTAAAAPAEASTTSRSIVEAGGLPRSDYPGFPEEFQRLVADLPLTTVGAPASDPVAAGRST